MSATIPIVSIGRRAAEDVTRARRADVVGVFASSFHLETDTGRLVCIGHPRIGNGPLNALAVWDDDLATCAALGLRVGQVAAIGNDEIALAGGPAFRLDAAKVWMRPAWPVMTSRQAQADLCDEVTAYVCESAPAEGLARVLLGEEPRERLAHVLFRTAQAHVATLRGWCDGLGGRDRASDAQAEVAARGLVGLGPGLTPSGDDFLCGMLVALCAVGETKAAEDLGVWISRAPADATTRLSRAFLAAARDGEPTEGLYAAVAGVLAADARLLGHGLELLAATGHSSGWDMLAGALAVLARREW